MNTSMSLTEKYENYGFMGYEFLTALYYEANTSTTCKFELGKKIVLAKFENDKIYEKVTISASESDSYSGCLLLSEGALVIEMQVNFHIDDVETTAYLRGKDLNISGLKMPKKNKDEESEFESDLILNIDFVDSVWFMIDTAYYEFIQLRVDEDKWEEYRRKLAEYFRTDQNEEHMEYEDTYTEVV